VTAAAVAAAPFRRRRSLPRLALAAGVVAAVAASAVAAGAGRGALVNPDGWPLAQKFFVAAVHPQLDGSFLRLAWRSLLTTVSYAAIGTALALAIGVVFAPLVSRVWWGGPVSWLVSRVALVVPRGVHEVIWGLFFLNVLGVDPLVAVLAIGIPYGAVTAKVYSEILDETPRRPYDALRAAGAGRLAALVYGLAPQALPDLVSYGFYRFECAIRAAAILGLVGAGGLGFQILLSFQSLRYEEMWTFLWALVLLSGAADLWSSAVRRHRSSGRGWTARVSLAAWVALVAFSVWWVGLDPGKLVAARTRHLLGDVVGAAFPPHLRGESFGGLVRLSAETLAMSVLAGAIAFLLALAFAYPAARAGGSVRLRALPRLVAARFVLLLCRAIPPPVWALVFMFVLFPGILPGALALGVYNAGVVGRLCAEAAENAPLQPVRALRASGASAAQAFAYATVPATFGRFAAYGFYRWEVAVRETVVVGVVGAGGLGVLLRAQLAGFDYASVVTTLVALIVLTLVADLASALARRALAA
jgi:phosphonate transport system permease protein